ncbi:MAG: pyrroloquinoline quinone-dependent dehydrogenase [Pirellulaceae bacterium]
MIFDLFAWIPGVIFSTLIFANASDQNDWPGIGNDPGCMRYSTLDQINRTNVAQLKPAWTYRTGEGDRTNECTPLIIDGVMYITTNHLRCVALDAATGAELWSFDPFADGRERKLLASGGVNRGCTYWSDGQPEGERRILHGIADGRLFSIDARTGLLDPDFGTDGTKDLREDIERDLSRMPYGPTSAPAIWRDAVILGFSNGEGPGPAAPGDVRAFDVRTGKQIWRFHTVPREGEFGNDTWAEGSWQQRGGANAWGGVSVDTERGLVFCGLGSAAFDFYGGDRIGQNLFANCTIALNAATGERVWHYQTVHHDLWDHDLPIYPNLVTVNHDGRSIDAVAQVTKTGFVFLFDRETGQPLFEVTEVDATPSDTPGEEAWSTQPVPVKPPPFAQQSLDETNATNISPHARQFVLEKLAELRHRRYEPPSLEGSVVLPGFHGGATWSGASFDPRSGFLYVNSNNVPNILTLEFAADDSPYMFRHKGYTQFLDEEGYPAIEPPWGVLTAIDLNRGEFVWQVPLGEHAELTARGVPQTGTVNFGGSIVTAGDLVFIGGTKDEKFRAFDAASGEILWEHKLPAGGYATPSTYAVDGKQYVVIAAGGAGKPGTKPGDAFVAFCLE